MSSSRQTAAYRQPLRNFLTLAPATSATSKQPLTAAALATVPKTEQTFNATVPVEIKRRTSSLSSEGSKRFLKLNNHHQDTNGDFAEEAVE